MSWLDAAYRIPIAVPMPEMIRNAVGAPMPRVSMYIVAPDKAVDA